MGQYDETGRTEGAVLMKLKYAVVLYEGPNNWNASSPDVPGCFSTGKDVHDMRRMIREALEFHLECLALDGDPIPWPKCTTVQEALVADAAFGAEIAAEYPDDPTDEDEGWSPPIAEMIEIEVNLPQSVRR